MPRSGTGGCIRHAFVACCFLAGCAAAAHAGRYEDAVSAYEAGKYRAAYELMLPLAEAGNCRAQFALGEIVEGFDSSYGHPPPSQVDLEWAKRALGNDREALVEAAFHWLLRAAEQGHAQAQLRIADRYQSMTFVDTVLTTSGEPQEPSPEDRARLAAQDAELRELEAKSWEWKERSANGGDPIAMFEMSVHAEAQHDRVQALMWAILSEERGFGPAERFPNILRRWMKPDDVLEAERRAEAWRAAHANDPPWGRC